MVCTNTHFEIAKGVRMNLCEQSCMDCPFRRDTEQGLPNEEEPYEFYSRYMTGLFVPYICPDQDAVCFGQLTMMANLRLGMMMEGHELKEVVYLTEQNWSVYFTGNNEFIRFHREGYIFGADWLRKIRRMRGWDKTEMPEQLTLF